MRKTWRKRNLLLLCFILLLLALGYIFRYELILQFQVSRLRSLNCHDANGVKTNCMNKLWVHRVNTLKRYDILEGKFNGFESDIVYNKVSHSFSVYHPPLTMQGNSLSLKQLLDHVDTESKYLWLDTRLVDSSNMLDALNALAAVTDTIGFNHNFLIVELYDMAAAKKFSENGFTVALNVSEELQKDLILGKISKDSLNAELRSVKYVSQESHYVPNLKKFFPGKPIVTWHPKFKAFLNRKEIQQLLDDPQIAIILVNIKSRYYK